MKPKIYKAPRMYEALKDAQAELTEALGEWYFVDELYCPSWTQPIKKALSNIESALAKAEGQE